MMFYLRHQCYTSSSLSFLNVLLIHCTNFVLPLTNLLIHVEHGWGDLAFTELLTLMHKIRICSYSQSSCGPLVECSLDWSLVQLRTPILFLTHFVTSVASHCLHMQLLLRRQSLAISYLLLWRFYISTSIISITLINGVCCCVFKLAQRLTVNLIINGLAIRHFFRLVRSG